MVQDKVFKSRFYSFKRKRLKINPYSETKSENETRTKAKHVASVISETMKQCIPNNLARYSDDFEPRAFGDSMQKFGVGTVLIEAGHSKNDIEKKFIRKLLFENFDVIVSTQLERALKETIENYEPRVSVSKILIKPDPDRNGYNVTLNFFIINLTNPVTITFFLERIR